MRVRYEVPVWALLFSVPVALLAINCGPANLDTESADKSEQVVSEKAMDMDASMDMAAVPNDQMATDTDSLNMNDEGSSDSWRRRHWRGGWGGYRGYYRGYGFGLPYGYGYSYPYYNYSNPWWLY